MVGVPDTSPKHTISAWLESEIALKPDCQVVDAIRSSTSDTALNESALLQKLRQLAEPEEAGDESY